MILKSVITCPHCGTAKTETMPTDACRFFYAAISAIGRESASTIVTSFYPALPI